MTKAETRPTDTAPVVRDGPNGPELVQMRWGFEPRVGGEPVINIRAEAADLSCNRCLILATDFELFTGAEHPKRRWTVTLKGEPQFFLAGLWRPGCETWPASYAIITVDAAPDLAPLSDRQPAVIRPSEAAEWLSTSADPRALLKPLPSGSYDAES